MSTLSDCYCCQAGRKNDAVWWVYDPSWGYDFDTYSHSCSVCLPLFDAVEVVRLGCDARPIGRTILGRPLR